MIYHEENRDVTVTYYPYDGTNFYRVDRDGMTYFHQNGDLLFKNPWDESDPEIAAMSDTKKEYLKWVITEFNKNRFPNFVS